MSYLVLVRHGRSEWNVKGLWTGWTDVPLASPEGFEDARKSGENLKDINFQKAYVSSQIRAKQTLSEIQKALGQDFPVVETQNLWERNYGIYTGKNKWQMKDVLGEKEFRLLRRSWNHPVPEGETMEDVYNRVVPFYIDKILPDLKKGFNVLVVGSGNSLRTLVKYLENIPDQDIADLEFGIGEDYVYQIDESGKVLAKQIRNKNQMLGKI